MRNLFRTTLAVLVAGAVLSLAKPANNAVYRVLTRRHRELIAEIAKYEPDAFEKYKPTTSSGSGGAGYFFGGGPFIFPDIRMLEDKLREYQETRGGD